MTVKELREALAKFKDEDAQVVVGPDPRDWAHPMWTAEASVNLGRLVERVFFIGAELPAEESDEEDCVECARLRDVIDDARRELDAA